MVGSPLFFIEINLIQSIGKVSSLQLIVKESRQKRGTIQSVNEILQSFLELCQKMSLKRNNSIELNTKKSKKVKRLNTVLIDEDNDPDSVGSSTPPKQQKVASSIVLGSTPKKDFEDDETEKQNSEEENEKKHSQSPQQARSSFKAPLKLQPTQIMHKDGTASTSASTNDTKSNEQQKPERSNPKLLLSKSFAVRAQFKTEADLPASPRKFRILLIRHAQSMANVDKQTLLSVADHAIDISHEGREQARKVGRFINQHYQKLYAERADIKSKHIRIWTSKKKKCRKRKNAKN